MGLSFRLGSSWGCNGGGGVSYTTVRLEGAGGALTYSCKLSGSLWYFLNQYHQARPGGWINEHKFQTQRERGKEKFTLNLKFHTKCIYCIHV